MATSKITFKYNIDSKDVEIASDRTLTLKQEAKALYSELQNLSNAGKENSVEFELLSKKYNETNDNLSRVNAKSRELFSTFSLLPGAIGNISGQLDGSIGLLKTFSGFSLKDLKSQFGGLIDDIGDIFSNILGLNTANKQLAVSTKQVAVAQEGATVAAEAGAVANEGLAVAEEGATVAATGLGTALKALGIGLIIAAVAALIAYWDDLVDAISGASDVTRAYDDAQKEVTKDITAFNEKLFEVKSALKAAESGTMSKEEALKKYNDTLGSTVGYAGSLQQAESLMASNTKVVIEGIKLRAQAQVFYAKSAEAAAKAVSGEGVDPSFWQTIGDYIKSGGNAIGFINNQTKTVGENYIELNNIQTKFAAEGDKLTAQAIENDKKLKAGLAAPPEPPKTKTSTGKDPAIEAKKEALKGISDLEKEGYLNSLSARDKEEALVQQKYSKALADAIKYGHDTKSLKESQQRELDKIAEKFETEAYKKEIDRQKGFNQQKLDESNSFYDKQKALYGEDSAQAKAALQSKYEAEIKIYQDELTALNNKASKGMKLTDDEIKKQGELTSSILRVSTTQEIEGLKSIDRETALAVKKAENQIKALDIELENENTRLERKKEIIAEESRIEKEAYDAAILAAGENQVKRDEIEAAHTLFIQQQSDKRIAIEKASVDARSKIALTYLQAVEQLGSLLQGIAEENKDLAITGLLIEKAAALASIAINAKKNFIDDGGIKSPIAWANLAVAGVSALAVVVSAVKGVNDIKNAGGGGNSGGAPANNGPAVPKPRGMATGGLVTGPGTSTSDSIPTMLSAGESVINAQSTAMFTPLLSSINQMGGGARFADSGIESYSSINNSDPYSNVSGKSPMIKAYVVAQDMTNQQMYDRNAKMRSTI